MFLLVINDYYEVGLIFFIVVQLIYFFHLTKQTNYKFFIFVRLLFIVIGLFILIKIDYFDLLNILVIFYFSNLLINTIQSYSTNSILLKVGLSLFVCCDICVGMFNIFNSGVLFELSSYLMWIFYFIIKISFS